MKYHIQPMFSGPELVLLAIVGSQLPLSPCRVLFRIFGKCIIIFIYFCMLC